MAWGRLRAAFTLSLRRSAGFSADFADAVARAEDAFSDHKNLFGQVTALSGLTNDLGRRKPVHRRIGMAS